MKSKLSFRNIISLFSILFLVSCTKISQHKSTIDEIVTYSSEDKNSIPTPIGFYKNAETGDVIYFVKK